MADSLSMDSKNDEDLDQDFALITALHSELDNEDDGTLQRLKSAFCHTGRGRPPKLPVYNTLTNRLLLQVHHIVKETGASWETANGWLSKIFPDYPLHRFSKHVKEAVVKALSLPEGSRKDFFDSMAVDINYIGEFSARIGLGRKQVLDFSEISLKCQITNGLLLELSQFCDVEKLSISHLLHLLQALDDDFEIKDTKYLREQKNRVKNTFMTLNRDKLRNDNAGYKYKFEIFSAMRKEQPLPRTPPVTPKATKKQATPQSAKKADCDVELLKVQVSTLKELVTEKNNELKKIMTGLTEKNTVIKNLEAKCAELNSKLIKKEKDLKGSFDQIEEVKSSGTYQRTLRKLSELEEREKQLEKRLPSIKSAEVDRLKERVRGLQTLVSNYKLTNEANSLKAKERFNEIRALKGELVVVESELMHLRDDDSFQTRDGNRFTDQVEMCAMELIGECEVSSKNVKKVMQCVSKWLHGKKLGDSALPSASSVCNFVDRAHVLAKCQVAEEASESQSWDLHSDGTSRDHRKIIGKQMTLDSGKTVSVGFSPVAVEDSASLLDNVIAMIDELSDLYSDCEGKEKDTVFRSLLEKMFAVMGDRCSVNKAFNNLLAEYKSNYFGTEIDTHFLFCNAHFLLGLSTAIEAKLKVIEKDLAGELGHALGRDAFPKFRSFKNASGSASCRFVRLGCDVLGPRGDEKNGCRMKWLSFLEESLGKKSKVTSFRMNRFNNFFLGAATLVHHSTDLLEFLQWFETLNMKLESVQLDCESKEILALARALGILYYKVTGPFWLMLQGDVEYVDQYLYVQEMLSKFKQWETDSTSLLARDQNGIFAEFNPPHDEVYDSLFAEKFLLSAALTKAALEKLMTACIEVTERQLVDFLPGGRYSSPPSEALRSSMKHCKLTNLISEWEFGELDFGMFKRRSASLFFHSSLQMVKRNKTISQWLTSKPSEEQQRLLKFARSKATTMRAKYRNEEKAVKVKTMARLEESRLNKEKKKAALVTLMERTTATVLAHGGPCMNAADVDRVLSRGKSRTQQMGILKDEIRYATKVLGKKDDRLVMARKSFLVLRADFISLLDPNAVVSDQPPPVARPSMSGEAAQTVCRKRKYAEVANSEESDSDSDFRTPLDLSSDEFPDTSDIETESSDDDEWDFKYTFSRQGVPVAVAYNEGFFIGEVVQVESEQVAKVQFMKGGYGNTFKWPQVEDLDEHVEAGFVIHADFSILVKGRSSLVPDLGKIQKQYSTFKKLFLD